LLSSLRSLNGAQLTNVRFSVCGLGDTNYAKFCQCAKDFDAALARLGATRVNDRVDCDLDYDGPFQSWLEKSLSSLSAGANSSAILAVAPSEISNRPSEIASAAAPDEPRFSKKNPFHAPVLAVRCLNAAGSAKEVNHVEFSLADSELTYEAGDALGVYPQHCPQLVAEVLAALGCDGEESVPAPSGSPTSLRRALTDFYDLGRPAPALIELLALDTEKHGQPHDVLDALRQSKIENPKSKILPPTDFVATLKRLQPRLYSISSSPRAHAGQVHLTVGAVRYDLAGRARKGVCSTFLAERALAVGRAGVFVHRNPNFRLPTNGDTPVIMVGPGTGIAPFRAFLAERRATGAKGRNWLFFGDQKSSTDFLYREELEDLQRDGTLTRLDLAWSRDAATKTYVQHRMLENAAELFAWLEAGANFYVCGDASRMARDVDEALVQAVARASGRTPDKAADYVAQLKSARRYQRDVY
ncbi:MAG TPA: sulfite reductase subunit alpha, partial [Acidobacteriota bacterium]|nr:sulfite reductase subunit alpha [Acidobacteriota bacterium]